MNEAGANPDITAQNSLTCILCSVYQEFAPLALLTTHLLDLFWSQHPQILYCGVESLRPDLDQSVIVRTHRPTDFASILHKAVCTTIDMGYRQCYLILEEHPPLDLCNSLILNSGLPELMRRLDASYIGLWGWDQKRHSAKGITMGTEHAHLQRLPVDYSGKFSLHPALWNLSILKGVLEAVLLQPNSQSPWKFESLSGSSRFAVPASWKSSCYRVSATASGLNSPSKIGQLLANVTRYGWAKVMAIHHLLSSRKLQHIIWQMSGFENIYFPGPYPMFFAGIMRKGGINKYLIRFLKRSGRQLLLNKIVGAVEEVAGQSSR